MATSNIKKISPSGGVTKQTLYITCSIFSAKSAQFYYGGNTLRNNFQTNETRVEKLKSYIMGWTNYFKIGDMKILLEKVDEWMRRRIRMVYWKQWKRVKTRYKMLQSLGIDKQKAWEYANTRKGYWRTSNSHILKTSLNNETLKVLFRLLSTSHSVNKGTAVYRTVRTVV